MCGKSTFFAGEGLSTLALRLLYRKGLKLSVESENTNMRAVSALLLAATMWGIFWYPLRLLEAGGMAGLWAAFYIYIGTLPAAIPVLLRYRREFVVHPMLLGVIALASGWCNVSFFLAMLEGNVVRVLLLFYLAPIWTVILGAFLLRERPSPWSMVHLALAMAGAIFMLWDPAVAKPWPQTYADWLAISSGFGFALANVMTRKGAHISDGSKIAAAWWGAFIVAIVWLLFDTPLEHSFTGGSIIAALCLGLFGIVVMTTSVFYGVSRMPVHRSAVILLFELVIGAVSAQLLTDEIVIPREWAGGALILIAAWLSARQPSVTAAPA